MEAELIKEIIMHYNLRDWEVPWGPPGLVGGRRMAGRGGPPGDQRGERGRVCLWLQEE